MIVALRDRVAGTLGAHDYGTKVDGALHVFTSVLQKAMHGDPEVGQLVLPVPTFDVLIQ